MGSRIDIEQILIQEQIKYIQKEVAMIKEFYCGSYTDSYGREYDIDLAWFNIQTKYEQLIEEEETPEGKLKYYKMMYQECVDLVFDEIESQPEPLLYEKDMCGVDSKLIVYEE